MIDPVPAKRFEVRAHRDLTFAIEHEAGQVYVGLNFGRRFELVNLSSEKGARERAIYDAMEKMAEEFYA